MNQNESSETSAQPVVLPEHIRQNLKKYRQHAERITCLECGYVGPMGIKMSIKPWYATWWGSILLAVIAASIASAVFGGIGMMIAVIVGGVVSALALSGSREIHSCPNCEVDLQTR
ncbi:hypothetical protein NB699_003303 [Xanthomonas sacchari]|uniref:Transmembrane protein n=1 Tax=Xanthomonas sacchari TaxID=56458 RepID=A0AA46SVL6_9XANT|nr:hypothetical protein [Xanthomonas sacchari]MCW0368320.1 hypothetical protein [Xanthomonas sacchari]MCW0441737.1 hypothetical protein [Xanthomonas sacchari]UYK89303.1 hypothetical protein NG824_02255 [Xanthomonas sacchari]